MNLVRMCSLPVTRVLSVHCSLCWQIWAVCLSVSQCSLKVTTQLQTNLFIPVTQRMHNVQFVLVKIPVSVQAMPNTPVRSPRTAADEHRHSGKVLGCANWGRPIRWLVTCDRTFFTPWPYLSAGLHIALRPCSGPRPNTSSTAHTHTHTHYNLLLQHQSCYIHKHPCIQSNGHYSRNGKSLHIRCNSSTSLSNYVPPQIGIPLEKPKVLPPTKRFPYFI
jgi:hypothetical protein